MWLLVLLGTWAILAPYGAEGASFIAFILSPFILIAYLLIDGCIKGIRR